MNDKTDAPLTEAAATLNEAKDDKTRRLRELAELLEQAPQASNETEDVYATRLAQVVAKWPEGRWLALKPELQRFVNDTLATSCGGAQGW